MLTEPRFPAFAGVEFESCLGNNSFGEELFFYVSCTEKLVVWNSSLCNISAKILQSSRRNSRIKKCVIHYSHIVGPALVSTLQCLDTVAELSCTEKNLLT